MDTVSNRTC